MTQNLHMYWRSLEAFHVRALRHKATQKFNSLRYVAQHAHISKYRADQSAATSENQTLLVAMIHRIPNLLPKQFYTSDSGRLCMVRIQIRVMP